MGGGVEPRRLLRVSVSRLLDRADAETRATWGCGCSADGEDGRESGWGGSKAQLRVIAAVAGGTTGLVGRSTCDEVQRPRVRATAATKTGTRQMRVERGLVAEGVKSAAR